MAPKNAVKEDAIVQEAPAGAIEIADFGEYANAGLDDVTAADLKTPFVKLLQTNSKELAEGTVDGKAGQFLNTASGDLYPMAGFNVLLIGKTHQFVEWKPRDAGGGYIAAHSPTSDFVKRTFAHNSGRTYGKLATPEGNELIESHDAFIVILNEDGTMPVDSAIFPFVSTKINAIKTWYTKIMTTKIPGLKPDPVTKKLKRPPLFSWRSRIVGFKDPKTAKGIFYNVKVDPFVANDWLASIIRPAAERDLLESAAGYYDLFHSASFKEQAEETYKKATNPSTTDTEGDAVPF
jgi:hypothetical protein